jgi:hypothetical protein
LGAIVVSGQGGAKALKMLNMLAQSGIKNRLLWTLVDDVRMAARFLVHPADEEADVQCVVDFLEDHQILADGFERERWHVDGEVMEVEVGHLEYGDLVHLLHKSLGVRGCLRRLRSLARANMSFSTWVELEAAVTPVPLPTLAMRQHLAARLGELHLVCSVMELDALLLMGGVDDIIGHIDVLAAEGGLDKALAPHANALSPIADAVEAHLLAELNTLRAKSY